MTIYVKYCLVQNYNPALYRIVILSCTENCLVGKITYRPFAMSKYKLYENVYFMYLYLSITNTLCCSLFNVYASKVQVPYQILPLIAFTQADDLMLDRRKLGSSGQDYLIIAGGDDGCIQISFIRVILTFHGVV